MGLGGRAKGPWKIILPSIFGICPVASSVSILNVCYIYRNEEKSSRSIYKNEIYFPAEKVDKESVLGNYEAQN